MCFFSTVLLSVIRITRDTRNMIANAISSTEFILASREASFHSM